jgi:hypothetical protein
MVSRTHLLELVRDFDAPAMAHAVAESPTLLAETLAGRMSLAPA